MRTHLVIPDTQVKPGVPTDHLGWIGRYILEKRPDVVVHLGDHWDMPSLSSYDKGKLRFEGRRYREDVDAGNQAMRQMRHPVEQFNYGRRRRGQDEYLPEWVFLFGNHEDRIDRGRQEYPWLDGMIGYHDLDTAGWQTFPFLTPVWIDGVAYSHFFANPNTGKPWGGAAPTRLKNIGHSFTMGHQQTLDYALRPVGRGMHHGLIAGAAYLHDEDYKGAQANNHWRGIIIKHQVEDGSYDPSFISLDYLCRRYEGVRLQEFMASRYPDVVQHRWTAVV